MRVGRRRSNLGCRYARPSSRQRRPKRDVRVCMSSGLTAHANVWPDASVQMEQRLAYLDPRAIAPIAVAFVLFDRHEDAEHIARVRDVARRNKQATQEFLPRWNEAEKEAREDRKKRTGTD